MSESTKKDRHNHKQASETKAEIWDKEALMNIEDGLRTLRLFRNKYIGGRSYHLRNAARSFVMAADRQDEAMRLRGETLAVFESKKGDEEE